ncbi:MAG TPA: PHB depolymerase family esterase [Pseudonocardia sp.]
MTPSRRPGGIAAARGGLLLIVSVLLVVGLVSVLRTGSGMGVGAPSASGTRPAVMRAPAKAEPIAAVHTLNINGVDRTYRSYRPVGPAGHWPMLIVLHGRGQSWRTAVDQTDFLGLARRRQAVLVYPDGIGRSWNAGGGCCGAAAAGKVPDMAFINAVLTDSLRELPVDPSRVYLVGYSNGGKLAYDLDCLSPVRFAALATYGAVPLTACPAGTPPTPVLIAVGRRDSILPFTGAAKAHPPTPSIRAALGWLRAQDGCTGAPTTVTVGHAVQQDWTRCTAGSEVASVLYTDQGHSWPKTPTAGTPSVSALIWQFLITHRLTGPPAPAPDSAVETS